MKKTRARPQTAGPPSTPSAPPPGPDVGHYLVERGVLCRRVRAARGEIYIEPLANFTAAITEHVTQDDGAEPQHLYVLAGTLASGRPLPRVAVRAAEFSGMGWVVTRWGPYASIRAGQAMKDATREALQVLSADVALRTVFTHTGWRQIEGQWRFLTGSGAVGDPTVEVELGAPELSRYALPAASTPEQIRASVLLSLALLDIAPPTVTYPMLAATARAVLCEVLPCDLSVWLEGETGSFKTTLAGLFLAHYGAFDEKNLTGSWTSTANYLERLAFLAKDVLLVIDDFAPTAGEFAELQRKAERVLRSQGNLSGRGRLRADLGLRPTMPPRGLIISTGEQHPLGHSLVARTVIVEMAKGDVDLARLTAAQATADQLPHALAGYVAWLAPQLSTLGATLAAAFREQRASGLGGRTHRRLPANIAQLAVGLECYLAFAEAIGALSAAEGAARRAQAVAAFTTLVDRQERALAAEHAVLRFLRGLNAILVSGVHVLVDTVAATEAADAPSVIGWDDGEFLFLSPEIAYRAIVHHYRDAGEPFPIRQGRLMQDLLQAGLSRCDEGRTTTTQSIGGQKRRVLQLDRALVAKRLGDELPPPWKPPVKGGGDPAWPPL